MNTIQTFGAALLSATLAASAHAQHIILADIVYTMAGEPIEDGAVVIAEDGTIESVGPQNQRALPDGYEIHEAAIVIPGLVDVRGTVGLTGMYNVDHDQDMLEGGGSIQPELRAFDAYNTREPLVGYVRSLGVTTVHIAHAPGALVQGISAIVKTAGNTVDDAVVVEEKAVVATLGQGALKGGGESPGTRGKAMAMLRTELIKAQEHLRKRDADSDQSEDDDSDDADEEKQPPARDLGMEAMARVLSGDMPLIITAEKAQDIASALRLQEEFGFELWLDGCAECQALTAEIEEAGVPVLLHPTMRRAYGETANQSYATASVLAETGIPFAIQTGYEGYVPKVRVLLFEAAVAAGYGELGFERALQAVTIDAAKILGIDDRVGSIEPGKDADLAMFDGDPFEYTTHCLGTFINGKLHAGEEDYEIPYP